MTTFVEIAVNVPQVTDVFHYHLSVELEGRVHPGHLVEVPFGSRQVQGVVLRFIERPAVSETRPVTALVDPLAVLTPAQLELAAHLAHNSLSPLAVWIGLMLPSGLSQQVDTLYSLAERPGRRLVKPLTPIQERLIRLLQKRGSLRSRQLTLALPHVEWQNAARSLVRRGLLTTQSVLPPPGVGPKTVRMVRLADSPEAVKTQFPRLGRAGSTALRRRQAALSFLLQESDAVEVTWVAAQTGATRQDLLKLAELGLVEVSESRAWRDPVGVLDPDIAQALSIPPGLTRDQQACWQDIQRGMEAVEREAPAPPYLLHGVTGSGKTEIYLRAVNLVVTRGKQAIVLVPEIALTPQAVQRFASRFPGRVGLVHSQLSPGERYDTWLRARAGELDVVVGPRSAIFTPLPRIGLIVMDECHDDSYYQSDPPFYHTREVAIAYTRLTGAFLLLGSATPDIVDVYQASQDKWHYLRLPARILAHRQVVQTQSQRLGLVPRFQPLEGQAETMDLPPVKVVDMRRELKAGNRSIFSHALQTSLAKVLGQGQQAILFLNRRGLATYVFCRDCGAALRCPRCDLPLTYHGVLRDDGAERLVCHHCGYQRQMAAVCPACGSQRIRQFGTGTERVEAEVLARFPGVRTLRWDFETTRKKGAHALILSHFAARRAEVLVGTQMLAKGLDLPLVTLVGVVLADVGLNLPDYTAPERTFQVLAQVAGRAGRSPLGGEVILQTFQPDHYVIQAAARHDYGSFYRQELEQRRRLAYPPFTRLVRLEYRHSDPIMAEAAARAMGERIQGWLEAEDRRATQLIGPVPCFYARLGGLYRWQIVLRGPNPASLLHGRTWHDWRVELDPPSLL